MPRINACEPWRTWTNSFSAIAFSLTSKQSFMGVRRLDTFEHYQLLKDDQGKYIELGHGGMGVTYKAFDTSLYCQVALKVIAASLLGSSTAEERFLREARSAAQLRHRNVASFFTSGSATRVITMPWSSSTGKPSKNL